MTSFVCLQRHHRRLHVRHQLTKQLPSHSSVATRRHCLPSAARLLLLPQVRQQVFPGLAITAHSSTRRTRRAVRCAVCRHLESCFWRHVERFCDSSEASLLSSRVNSSLFFVQLSSIRWTLYIPVHRKFFVWSTMCLLIVVFKSVLLVFVQPF